MRSAEVIEVPDASEREAADEVRLVAAAGEIAVNSVSGDATVDVASISRGRFKTVSGDMRVVAALTADGRFEAESVSGDFTVDFRGAAPPAEYDV